MVLLADSQQQIDDNVHHLEWKLGPLSVNGDTVFVTGIAVAVLFLIAFLIRRELGRDRPGRFVSAVEAIVEFIDGLVKTTLGDRSTRLRLIGPLAICLFTFLLVSNLIGLVPTMHSPTNDVNTALALAIISIIFLHVSSIRARGGRGYVKHYFSVVEPKWTAGFGAGALSRILFAFLEVIQEFSRPVTLTFRLYFNIFVGELLLLLITALFPTTWVPVWLGFGGIWLAFSIFVSGVQAFIFTMLTIAYVAMGTETHGAEHDDHGSDDAAHSAA